MLTLIIFIVVISLLVFVHEVGHFVAAKRSGMKVEEFGFGFPPRLVGFRRGETIYSVNWIPFGGFVKIFGENSSEHRESRSFGSAPFSRKVLVVVAGVLMNFLFAAFLLILANFFGLRVGLFDQNLITIAQDKKIQIIEVSEESPARAAGLQTLDEIIGFRLSDGSVLRTISPEVIQEFAYANAETEATMVIVRGDEQMDIPISLRQAISPTEGPIGISLALTGVVSYPWYESIWRGIADSAFIFVAIGWGYIKIIASIFTDGRLATQVSGPVGIATLTGQAASIGFNYLMQFVALISLNLAVLNIIPFPALDGGRLMMLVSEKVRGRAMQARTERLINGIGFMVLIILMALVTIKDVGRLFE